MKILWVSHHLPVRRQLDRLQDLFPGVTVDTWSQDFKSVQQVLDKMKGYDDLVFVGPLSVLAELCKRGVKPLFAKMEQVPREQADLLANGRAYRFVKFLRVESVEVTFSEVEKGE